MEKENKIPMKFNIWPPKYEPDLEQIKKYAERWELIERIIQKREFSQLPKTDVEIAFSHFEKRQVSDEEKIRLTRELLHKVFGAFVSQKLLSPKNKSEKWILRKHLSTRERLPFYRRVYTRIFSGIKEANIIDLGCGINGLSIKIIEENVEVKKYIGIESVGQLVELVNSYFKKEKIRGRVIHESLFDLKNIKRIILTQKKPRIILLFKMIGPLEAMEDNYSKKLISEISPLADRVVVSFATESMQRRLRFKWKRAWLTSFIENNFRILDDFELGGERYLVFCKK